jgi:hypothetical protein
VGTDFGRSGAPPPRRVVRRSRAVARPASARRERRPWRPGQWPSVAECALPWRLGCLAAARPETVPPLGPPQPSVAATIVPKDRGRLPDASSGAYAVQVSAQKTKAEAQSSYRALQGKYPAVLGGRDASIRRIDLGEGGIFYRADRTARRGILSLHRILIF